MESQQNPIQTFEPTNNLMYDSMSPSSPEAVQNPSPAPTVAPTAAPTVAPTVAATVVPTAATTAAPDSSNACASVVTIPVPVVQSEEYYQYVTVKGSLHDRSCAIFGLNEDEIQALNKRIPTGVKRVINGVMVAVPPMVILNLLAQLSYKVVCSCGEAEICWTMQREV